jgi:hypothetical protein
MCEQLNFRGIVGISAELFRISGELPEFPVNWQIRFLMNWQNSWTQLNNRVDRVSNSAMYDHANTIITLVFIGQVNMSITLIVGCWRQFFSGGKKSSAISCPL